MTEPVEGHQILKEEKEPVQDAGRIYNDRDRCTEWEKINKTLNLSNG